MTQKLYVGNLSYDVDEETLKGEFGAHGTVESVKVITDNHTGRSKGFAFVEMSSEEEATASQEAINGKEILGRAVRVDKARPQEKRSGPRGGGGGGGFRGRN